MLGKAYTFTRDCCGTLVTKNQFTKIRLMVNDPSNAASTEKILAADNQPVYSEGHLFHNIYVHYCLCCAYYNSFGWELELDNEIVSLSTIPCLCPCYGPYPVQNKEKQLVGELRPNCYCLKILCLFWSPMLPCISLDVTDSALQQTYKIRRDCCTCACCAHWTVKDMAGNARGDISQTGLCCPNYHVILPIDNQRNKLMVLTSVAYLP